jgi:16S rRNA (cytidine1402-2'-O)-methyltransferase
MQPGIGTLYIVATPIGNLEDTTARALRTLKEVDLIAAEDTRRTRKLLSHFNIATPLTSYFEHNEARKTPWLIDRLEKGGDVGLVSEAGTPGVSDPGYRLVREALGRNIRVIPVPGVSAVITALSVSGLPTDRFVFEGFLPRKQAKRKRFLEEIAEEERTLILFESPRRLKDALGAILEACGDRAVTIARELTKAHEEVIRGSLSEVMAKLEEKPIKGEVTIVLRGKPREKKRRSRQRVGQ